MNKQQNKSIQYILRDYTVTHYPKKAMTSVILFKETGVGAISLYAMELSKGADEILFISYRQEFRPKDFLDMFSKTYGKRVASKFTFLAHENVYYEGYTISKLTITFDRCR